MGFKIPNFAKQMGGSPFAMKSPLHVDRASQNTASDKKDQTGLKLQKIILKLEETGTQKII